MLLTSAVIDGAMADPAILSNFGGSWSNLVAFLGFILDNNFSILLIDTSLRENEILLYLFSSPITWMASVCFNDFKD